MTIISELIIAGLGYAYARRQYQTSPTLQAIVKRAKEIYEHSSRPVIEISEYGDGTGSVRSKESNFAGWVNWMIVKEGTVRAIPTPKRYPLAQCQELAANLKQHYETEYVEEQQRLAAKKVSETLVNRQVIRTEAK